MMATYRFMLPVPADTNIITSCSKRKADTNKYHFMCKCTQDINVYHFMLPVHS